MADRHAELQALAARLADEPAVEDAWVAKSFTDQLVVLDVPAGTDIPATVEAMLREHDLRGANKVYGTGASDVSFAGSANGLDRHQFVDTETRGEHQSYVVD